MVFSESSLCDSNSLNSSTNLKRLYSANQDYKDFYTSIMTMNISLVVRNCYCTEFAVARRTLCRIRLVLLKVG